MRGASPVILAASIQSLPHHEVLINLGPGVPEGFERFERVIEVVGLDDEVRLLARARWKHYAQHGHSVTSHDLSSQPSH